MTQLPFATPTNGNGVYVPKWLARSLIGLVVALMTSINGWLVYEFRGIREEMSARTAKRYTSDDAARDFKEVNDTVGVLRERVARLEGVR